MIFFFFNKIKKEDLREAENILTEIANFKYEKMQNQLYKLNIHFFLNKLIAIN